MAAPDADVAILGAGPAGAAAACALARRGRRVVVVDPGRAPAPRVETLPANGSAIAEAFGLGPALAAAALGTAAEMRLEWRASGERIAHRGAAPTLLDRGRLHRALRRAAINRGAIMIAARAGRLRDLGDRVEVEAGGTTLSARVVLDARGRAGAGRRGAGPAPDLVALPFHGRSVRAGAAAAPMLALEALADGWVWACFAPGGLVVGAVFLPSGVLAGAGARGRLAAVAARLDATVALRGLAGLAVRRPQAAGFRVAPAPLVGKRTILVGDAALARDPIASHGLVQALRSAAQAAAAAETLLDPAGEAEAARAFLRERYAAATEAALAATARAYADQSRFRTPFWTRAAATAERLHPRSVPATTGTLALAAPLRRCAALDGARIRWAEALPLPASGRCAAFVGPFAARGLVELLDPPAPLATLAARLANAAGADAARSTLAVLLAEGALTAATPAD